MPLKLNISADEKADDYCCDWRLMGYQQTPLAGRELLVFRRSCSFIPPVGVPPRLIALHLDCPLTADEV